MQLGIYIISKYFISSMLSLISILIFDDNQEVELNWYCLIYGSAYFISLIVFLSIKRFFPLNLKKKLKISFLGLTSLMEILLFFFMEFKILHDFPVAQRIASLNRMVFLYLRFFIVNKFFAIQKLQNVSIIIVYVINILICYFLNEKTNSRNNLLSIFLGILSIVFNFFITSTTKNHGIDSEILKNIDQTFFVIKKGRFNKLICSQGEAFQPFFHECLSKLNNQGIISLNDIFLVKKKKKCSEKNVNIVVDSSLFIENENLEKLNVEKCLANDKDFENGKLMRFNVKLRKDLSKTYILSIKRILFKKENYYIFNIDQPLIEQNVDCSRVKSFSSLLSSKILKSKNSINELVPLIEHLLFSDKLNTEDIDIYKLALTNIKLSLLRIDNLICYDLINNNKIIVNKTKIKLVDFLEEIKQTLNPLVKCRKLKFGISTEEILLNFEIETDLPKLRQILLNLLSNSFEFIINEGFVHLNVVLLDQQIKFIIKDSGIGFDNKQLEDLDFIFNEKIYDENKIFNFLSLYIANSLLKILYSDQTLEIKSLKNEGTSIAFSVKGSNQRGKINNNIGQMMDQSQAKTEPMKVRNSFTKFNSVLDINSFSFLNPISFPDRNRKRNNQDEVFKGMNTLTSTNNELSQKFQKTSSSLFQELIFENSIKKSCNCKEILLVDYEPFSFLPIRFIFKSLKIQYDLAFNKNEAIKKLSARNICTDIECHGFRLIFINCRSPANESINTIKEIKKTLDNNSCSKIPLIGTMSIISKEEMISCGGAGLNDFLLNPITLKAVKKCLINWKISKK